MPNLLGVLLVLLVGGLMACNSGPAPTPEPTSVRAEPTPAPTPGSTPTRATVTPTVTLPPGPSPMLEHLMRLEEVIPFLKEHAYVYWHEGVPESVFESLDALPPDVLTQVCYLANGVYQPILVLENWLDGPGIEPAPIEGIETYCASKGPNVHVPLTRERLDAIRTGLGEIQREHALRLCRVLGRGYASGVDAVNHLVARQLPESDKILDFLLDIGFQPSWRGWVLAQHQAHPIYETWASPEDLPKGGLVTKLKPWLPRRTRRSGLFLDTFATGPRVTRMSFTV